MKTAAHKKGFTRQNFVKQNLGGFTLIEALVALVLLTMTLAPILYFSSTSADVATSIINNMIAANLAQEGAEVIRAIRDSNYFADTAFDTELMSGTYEVQWDSQPPLIATIGVPNQLKIDASGLYNYLSGTDSMFFRTITINKVSSVELVVTSEVTWTERSRDRSVEVEDHLYDWK